MKIKEDRANRLKNLKKRMQKVLKTQFKDLCLQIDSIDFVM